MRPGRACVCVKGTTMAVKAEAIGDDRRAVPSLLLSHRARRRQRIAAGLGSGALFAVTSLSLFAVLFIFYFIARDALPFFKLEGVREFFASTRWYPSAEKPEFGALAMFVGSGLVTLGAIVVAVPLGISAAVCLSDVIPFSLRQWVKPVIEVLAAIPSVAYGFFALVVFAPLLQQRGGHLLAATVWIVGLPVAALGIIVLSDIATDRLDDNRRSAARWAIMAFLGAGALAGLVIAGKALGALHIASGTNALNVSIILGIMALPTVVSVSEDALQAVGRELREGSYALGATRAETIVKTVLPAASSGILAAIILGIMRAIGETMVVWMASGNAAQIPSPWWDLTQSVRTMTATIAGEMGETVQGSDHYRALFAIGLLLLAFTFALNLVTEHFLHRVRRAGGTSP